MPTINIENVIIVMIVAVGYTLLFRRFAANYMGKKTKQQAVLLDKYATRYTPGQKTSTVWGKNTVRFGFFMR